MKTVRARFFAVTASLTSIFHQGTDFFKGFADVCGIAFSAAWRISCVMISTDNSISSKSSMLVRLNLNKDQSAWSNFHLFGKTSLSDCEVQFIEIGKWSVYNWSSTTNQFNLVAKRGVQKDKSIGLKLLDRELR